MNVPIFDLHYTGSWSVESDTRLYFVWRDQTSQEDMEKYIEKYDIPKAIQQLSNSTALEWGSLPEALTLAYFLYNNCPALITYTRLRTLRTSDAFDHDMRPANQYPVLPGSATLHAIPNLLNIIRKQEPRIKSFTFRQGPQWTTMYTSGETDLRAPKDICLSLRDGLIEHVRAVMQQQYAIVPTIEYCLALSTERRIGNMIALDHLYAAWLYWIKHHGCESDLELARKIAWCDTGDEFTFTTKSLIQAVRETALASTRDAALLELEIPS